MRRKLVEQKVVQPRGVLGHAPQENFKNIYIYFFLQDIFSIINTQENAVVCCSFSLSQVLSVRYSVYRKKKASDAIRIME